jgi:hypothetical protein
MSEEERDQATAVASTETIAAANKRKRDITTGDQEERGDDSSSAVSKKPSSLITLFTAQDGTRTGPPIEIPINSTSKQLDTLINTLLENTEPVSRPYPSSADTVRVAAVRLLCE